jgi:hypothetical protein
MQRGDNEVFALLLEWFNFPTVPMQAEVNYVYIFCVCVCVYVCAFRQSGAAHRYGEI